MNTWQLDLDLIVLLLVGLMAAYAAHKWKELATPLTVGAIVVTLLVLLLQGQEPGQHEQRVEPSIPCQAADARRCGDVGSVLPSPAGTQNPVGNGSVRE